MTNETNRTALFEIAEKAANMQLTVNALAEISDSLPNATIEADTAEKLKDQLIVCAKFVENVSCFGCLNEATGEHDEPAVDYAEAKSNACQALTTLIIFFGVLKRLSDELDSSSRAILTKKFSDLSLPALVLCFQHSERYDWTCEKSEKLSHKLTSVLLSSTGCASVEKMLKLETSGSGNLFNNLAVILKPKLAKKTWRKNPAAAQVFAHTLQKVILSKISWENPFVPVFSRVPIAKKSDITQQRRNKCNETTES